MRVLDKKGAGIILTVLMLTSTSVTADTEIFRCLLEDGTIGFQEIPCDELATNADNARQSAENHTNSNIPAADDAFDFVNPFDEPAQAPTPAEPAPASQDRSECEKTTRDAIDVIDLEMRGKSYSKNEGEQYLAELLVLTRQLRACKQL